MKKRIITSVNVGLGDIEELQGYTIETAMGELGTDGEGFEIHAYRQINGAKLWRDFTKQDGAYYLSEEYVMEEKGREATNDY